jgi:hypothetical protein
MKEYKKTKSYRCVYCKVESEIVTVAQKETRYYSVNLQTSQWDDLHGSESVESQKFLCEKCNKYFSKKRINI